MRARTPTQRTNVAVAKRLWLATAEGDARALESALAADVVWRVHGHNPSTGEFHGRDAVIANIADFGHQVDDLRLSMRDVYASSRGAVISYGLWARRASRTIDSELMIRLQIEHGLIVEVDAVALDQASLDSFLSCLH